MSDEDPTPQEQAAAESARIIATILDDRLHGHLVDIAQACVSMLTGPKGSTGRRWRIVPPDGKGYTGMGTIDEEDLTLLESSAVEKLAGHPWSTIDPINSGLDCLAVMAACAHHRADYGANPRDAFAKVGAETTAVEAMNAFEFYEVPAAPKDPEA